MSYPLKRRRVVVVGSVRLYREGLAEALGRRAGLSVVGTAQTLQDVEARLVELAPDVVVVVDMVWPPRQGARDVGSAGLKIPVVALRSGASKLTRDTSLDQLVKIIDAAVGGDVERSPLSRRGRHRASTHVVSSPSDPQSLQLTAREREIGHLLKLDLSNKEIAALLGIELGTVKNHIHSVLEKLKVHRRTEAARIIDRASLASGSGLGLVLERRVKR
jgi:two-component system, NarL family, nitrate/nitrite response regulator NarL